MVTIKVRQNGSYRVEGDEVKLVDWNDAEYQIPKRPFALCRCGGSSNKPFLRWHTQAHRISSLRSREVSGRRQPDLVESPRELRLQRSAVSAQPSAFSDQHTLPSYRGRWPVPTERIMPLPVVA